MWESMTSVASVFKGSVNAVGEVSGRATTVRSGEDWSRCMKITGRREGKCAKALGFGSTVNREIVVAVDLINVHVRLRPLDTRCHKKAVQAGTLYKAPPCQARKVALTTDLS